jgi:MFS family permease
VVVKRVVTVLCLVQFIDVMGVTVVLTALPAILRDLHLPDAAATLVSASYAVLFGGFLMLGSRVGDRYGHRRTVMASLAAYAAASVLAMLSTGLASLTLARGLQGMAAAASVPAALRLLTTLTSAGEPRRRAVAAWSAAGAVAGASGFVVGGVATEVASWRLPFAITTAVAAALAVGVRAVVPADTRSARPPRLDLAAGLMLTAAVMCLVAGTTMLTEVGLFQGTGFVVLGGVLLVLLVLVERRCVEPILSGQVLSMSAVRVGATGSFVNTASTSSAATLATLYLQDGLGLSPLAAGAYLLPLSLAAVLGSVLAGAALRRRAMRAVLAMGLAVIAAGNLVLVAGQGQIAVLVAVATIGLGLGVASVAANSIGTDVLDALKGTSAGILNTAAQLGTAIGIAVIILIASFTSYTTGWTCAAATAAVTAAAMRRKRAVST